MHSPIERSSGKNSFTVGAGAVATGVLSGGGAAASVGSGEATANTATAIIAQTTQANTRVGTAPVYHRSLAA
jgi:hypothetical protein